jgi:hypothetical protein
MFVGIKSEGTSRLLNGLILVLRLRVLRRDGQLVSCYSYNKTEIALPLNGCSEEVLRHELSLQAQ